ncbi:MAG: hypothetical protein FWD02_03445 [Bacteroidales bacterium]|nr:hypothetical protein [Bacteroidales bacterium]
MKTLRELFELGPIEGFQAVKFMREQRNRLDAMFAKMTEEEILDYYKKSQERSSIRFGDHKEAKPYSFEMEQSIATESEFEYKTNKS